MATRVELNKDQVRQALDKEIASLKRSLNNVKNPAMKLLIEKDLADMTTAANTLTDTK